MLGGTLVEVRPGRLLHVAAREAGSDTTLFFVHGGGGNKEQWRFQWRHFSAGAVNLVAWDAVGHGRSPKPTDPAAYRGAELVADARAVFAAHRSARNVVVAHSYGARLLLAWLLAEASEHPLAGEGPASTMAEPSLAGTSSLADPAASPADRASAVDTAVLLGAAPLGQMGGRLLPGWLGRVPLPLLELARPLLARGFRKRAWAPGADPALVAAEQRATRGNTLAMMQALLAEAPAVEAAALRRLTQPMLILAGESDGLIPDAASAKLAGLLGNATLQRVPRCGHQIMLEAPDATDRAIGGMLTAAAPAASGR